MGRACGIGWRARAHAQTGLAGDHAGKSNPLFTANRHGWNASVQSTAGNHVCGRTEHTCYIVSLGNGEIDSRLRPDSLAALASTSAQSSMKRSALTISGYKRSSFFSRTRMRDVADLASRFVFSAGETPASSHRLRACVPPLKARPGSSQPEESAQRRRR
jgi:hypothetical protein